MTDATRRALRELCEKATPGPWRSMRDGNQYINTKYMPTAKLVGASRIDGIVRPWNPHALLAFGFKPEEYETARFLDKDADLIAAARNALPSLLDALDAAFREAEQAVEQSGCTCGCTALIRALAAHAPVADKESTK